MWLLIQSDRCPNKEIRTQTRRGTTTWGLGEDGHLHIKERGLGRRGPAHTGAAASRADGKQASAASPPARAASAAARPRSRQRPVQAEGGATADPPPPLMGESSGRAGGPGMSLLGKSMCSSDARGQSRRGFRQEAREGRVVREPTA